jgi:hypothetical protein
MLSTLPKEQIKLKRARDELKHVEEPGYWGIDNVDACDFVIIPEIAAGAVGYAFSSLRREGPHIIIDIGASTVDVCSFDLHRRAGDNEYRLLIADVKNFGLCAFYRYKLRTLKDIYEKHLQAKLDKHDPMLPVNMDERLDSYTVPTDILAEKSRALKESFKEQLVQMLYRVINQTRKRKLPYSTVWRANGRLPLLLIGGGSQVSFFRSAVDELGVRLQHWGWNTRLQVLTPTLPSSLTRSLKGQREHHFLTVTWGLSHRALDIGEIVPADQISDCRPSKPFNWRSRYTGKEQV